MAAEQVIRCTGSGCKAMLDGFVTQNGTNASGSFQVYSSVVAELPPQISYLTDFPIIWSIVGVGVLILTVLLLTGIFFTVSQQTVEIIERFGRFRKVAHPGLNIKLPLIDKRVDELSLRVQQLCIEVDTKTLDNVFVGLNIAIQYKVLATAIPDAAYKLDDVEAQLQSYVFDIVRRLVPKMKLDDVFAQKDEISKGVLLELTEKMTTYGYTIISTPITEVNPDSKVRTAMNEINAAQRMREAATEKGNADKILIVKAAEAKKESDILKGEGIAGQRKAIVEGLKAAVQGFSTDTGLSQKEVLNTVMMSQYFDMLKDLPKDGNTRVLLLPHSPSGMNDIGQQLRESLLVTEKGV